MRAQMQALKQTSHTVTHAVTSTPTFLQRFANFDVTVRPLEFIEEGADFEFVCDSFPELWHDGAVLPWGAHLEHRPLAPLQPLR